MKNQMKWWWMKETEGNVSEVQNQVKDDDHESDIQVLDQRVSIHHSAKDIQNSP